VTVTARPKGEVEHDLAQLAQIFSGPAERVSSRSVNPRIAFSGFRSWWVNHGKESRFRLEFAAGDIDLSAFGDVDYDHDHLGDAAVAATDGVGLTWKKRSNLFSCASAEKASPSRLRRNASTMSSSFPCSSRSERPTRSATAAPECLAAALGKAGRLPISRRVESCARHGPVGS